MQGLRSLAALISALTSRMSSQRIQMTCLISVGNSEKHGCLEALDTGGEFRHLDLNSGALILKEKSNGF